MRRKIQFPEKDLQSLRLILIILLQYEEAEVAEKLKEARSFGDLSENAEYDEAKNEQGILEARIAELENIIANAVVVDDDDISITEIGVGSIVKIRDLEFDEIEELRIVGSTEYLILTTIRFQMNHQ